MMLNFFRKKKEKIHLLHIGKTGGSNLKATLQKVNHKKYEFVFHPHEITLEDIPVGEKFYFCIRDPLARFQSGFYSRKRKGQPRYYTEWSRSEKLAFEKFDTPEDLAICLEIGDKDYEFAKSAMTSIEHVNSSYWDWFKNEEYFNSRISDLFYVLQLETFEKDFNNFLSKLSLSENVKLGNDKLTMHSNNVDYFLSDRSKENLKQWYRSEYEFMKFVNFKINKINQGV